VRRERDPRVDPLEAEIGEFRGIGVAELLLLGPVIVEGDQRQVHGFLPSMIIALLACT
jgi:hypothetical protein